MKYYITHSNSIGFNNIISRIKDVGINAYKYYNCIPTKIIELLEDYKDLKKGDKLIVFENYNDNDIDYLRFLGYGFEGLYEDNEKIKVIEEFGKYRCILYTDKEIEFPNNIIKEIDFTFE